MEAHAVVEGGEQEGRVGKMVEPDAAAPRWVRNPVPDPSDRPRATRTVAVIVVAAVAMLIADYVGSYVGLVAMFAAPLALVVVPLSTVALAAAISGTARGATGHRHVFGPVVSSVLLTGVLIYGLFTGQVPLLPLESNIGLHALCAVTLGLFLGPWPLRVLGVAAAVAVIALVSVQPTNRDIAANQTAETTQRSTVMSPRWPACSAP